MRHGCSERLSRDSEGRARHTLHAVYGEMLLQISRDYEQLPPVRSIKLHEIRFFYEGLRAELERATHPDSKPSRPRRPPFRRPSSPRRRR